MNSWDNIVVAAVSCLNRLEANQFPSMFGRGPEKPFFEHVAPKVSQLS